MRRAVLTLSGTVAGLVALFSYKTHVPGVTPVAAPATPAALTTSAPPTTGASPSSSPSKTPSKTPAKMTTTKAATTPTTAPPASTPASAKPTPAPTKAAPTTAPAKPSGTFEGPDVSTQYGPVQVVLTVANGKITAANDVQQPGDSIAANAIPQLNSETVQAQSANIQAVSGATYTSQGYIQSLQQAVNKAGL